jgi:transposase
VTVKLLPLRTGPRNGRHAFSPEGEDQIYDAVQEGMAPIQVAARVNTSLVTIYNICRRVSNRRLKDAPPPELGEA